MKFKSTFTVAIVFMTVGCAQKTRFSAEVVDVRILAESRTEVKIDSQSGAAAGGALIGGVLTGGIGGAVIGAAIGGSKDDNGTVIHVTDITGCSVRAKLPNEKILLFSTTISDRARKCALTRMSDKIIVEHCRGAGCLENNYYSWNGTGAEIEP